MQVARSQFDPRRARWFLPIVGAATIAAMAGCGGGKSNTQATTPSPSPVRKTPSCGPRTLAYDVETPLCSGRHDAPSEFEPKLRVVIPAPSAGFKWFGGLLSSDDLQIREGRRSCDGCEIGTVEVVSPHKSPAAAIRVFRRLKNVSSLHTRGGNAFGLPATEVRGRIGGGASHAFGGIEFTRGQLHAYVARLHEKTLVVLIGGKKQPFVADAARIRLRSG
jgi:hypothetical protein